MLQNFRGLLGEVVTDSTKKNLEMRVEAENGATAGKTELAKRAKELGLDAIHDTVHEMAKDEARHGRAFRGLPPQIFQVYTSYTRRGAACGALFFSLVMMQDCLTLRALQGVRKGGRVRVADLTCDLRKAHARFS